MSEVAITATLMRGGTSKGVFLCASDLPDEGPARDQLILALLGSPDPMQINGLGGTHSSTSKLVAVSPSDDPDSDIDYLFAQIAIDEPTVDYQGNCGNLTTAVAPFAIDEGLVPVEGDLATVTIRNLNTGVRIRSSVPLQDGRSSVEGDLSIAGVPGTGPAITTDYLDPGGSVLAGVLPTGNVQNRIDLADGTSIDVSIMDVTSPHAYVRAVDVDAADLDRLEMIRSACGAAVGLNSLAIPRLVIIGPGTDEATDLEGKAVSMQRIHHAFPMTGALCTAAAALIEGTLTQEASTYRGEGPIRLRHPKGVVEVRAEVEGRTVRSVGVTRTARRLLRGDAYVVVP